MDTLDTYRKIIENVLNEYAQIPYSYGDIEREIVFDREHDRYLLLSVGWEGRRRVHGALIHIDVIQDKVWIQGDKTEDGIANNLVAAGIPKEAIVLGFHSSGIRKHTEFAVA